jgi:hypothetical protein
MWALATSRHAALTHSIISFFTASAERDRVPDIVVDHTLGVGCLLTHYDDVFLIRGTLLSLQ